MRTQDIFTYSVRYAFFMLFIYAGLTKLLEEELLYHTIKDADILFTGSAANILASILPFIEIILGVFFLLTKKTLIYYIALCLFSLYLVFLILLLFYNETIPCTCRTALPVLGWYGHLYFTGGCFILTMYMIYAKRNMK